MKSLALLLFASSAFGASIVTDPNIAENNLKKSQQIISTIYEAYESYKAKDNNNCIGKLVSLNLTMSKSSTRKIQKNSTADSLVLLNNELERWAYFRSVDLGYLRNIEAGIIFKNENSELLLEQLSNELLRQGKKLKSINNDGDVYTFEDNAVVWIEDDRWKNKTYTKMTSLYTYTISVYDNYLDIQIEEVVPKKILTDDEMSDNGIAKL